MPRTVSLLAALLALAGCVRAESPDGGDAAALTDLPDGETWGAELRVSEGGQPRLVLAAPYMARYARPDSAYILLGPDPQAGAQPGGERVRVRLYEDGQLAASVEADRLTYAETDGRLDAAGNVAVQLLGDNPTTVRSDRLTYAEANGRLDAAGNVAVEITGSSPATIRAGRLTHRGRSGAFEAAGGAEVTATGGRTLRSGRIVFDPGSQQFRAPGAFTFTGPGERIRGVALVAAADLSRYTFRRAAGELEVQE